MEFLLAFSVASPGFGQFGPALAVQLPAGHGQGSQNDIDIDGRELGATFVSSRLDGFSQRLHLAEQLLDDLWVDRRHEDLVPVNVEQTLAVAKMQPATRPL